MANLIFYEEFLEFEDRMDAANLFTSGVSGRVQHREAYMTIIDFERLYAFLSEVKSEYSKTQWEYFAKMFIVNYGYLSPINVLVGKQIERVILARL